MLAHGDVGLALIAARDAVVELALNVGQQRTGTQAEQMRMRPLLTQLLHHQAQPRHGVLC